MGVTWRVDWSRVGENWTWVWSWVVGKGEGGGMDRLATEKMGMEGLRTVHMSSWSLPHPSSSS